MKLKILDGSFAVCRTDDRDILPLWAVRGETFCVTKAEGELSVVCAEEYVPDGILCEKDYCMFKIDEKLDFSLIGVLGKICDIMKNAGISIMAISTYDTDYVMVKNRNRDKAVESLKNSGYEFV